MSVAKVGGERRIQSLDAFYPAAGRGTGVARMLGIDVQVCRRFASLC
ncbi:hypothetical protein [Paraburkholderia guartelaensis]